MLDNTMSRPPRLLPDSNGDLPPDAPIGPLAPALERLRSDKRWRARVLWHGAWPADGLLVAVVGSRKPTEAQCAHTIALAHDLVAAGVTVVSGGARGIDTAALRAALAAGGRPVAVLPCHLDAAYPPENAELYADIVTAGGGVLALRDPALRLGAFAVRNRLLAEVVHSLIAVAADLPSGTLQAARAAVQAGAAVAVVPWPADSPRSAGTAWLAAHGVPAIGTPAALNGWLAQLVDRGLDAKNTEQSKALARRLATLPRRAAASAGRQSPLNTVDASGRPCPSYADFAAAGAVAAPLGEPADWWQWPPRQQAVWQALVAAGPRGAVLHSVVAATGADLAAAVAALFALALAGRARQGDDGAWRAT